MTNALDPWRCNGSRYVNMRTGALGPLLPDPVAFSPKNPGQAGLVTVDYPSLANYDQYGPSSYVLKVPMSAVMPSEFSFNWTPVDSVLDSMGTATMTLRIQMGGSAPGWLKDRLGRFTIFNNQLGLSAEVTKFWDPVALDAWDRMIRAAGARYNDDPRVVLVSSDEAMTLYSEPLILGGHRDSAILLNANGLDADSARNAMLVSTQSTCEAFNHTYVEFAGHSSWQQATPTGIVDNWPNARTLLNELVLRFKSQLVITSYGLDSTDFAVDFPATGTLANALNYYRWMRIRKGLPAEQGGGKIGFQLTLGAGQVHYGIERRDGAQNALDFGGDFVEHASWGTIYSDGTVGATAFGISELTRLDAGLKTTAGY